MNNRVTKLTLIAQVYEKMLHNMQVGHFFKQTALPTLDMEIFSYFKTFYNSQKGVVVENISYLSGMTTLILKVTGLTSHF